MCCLNKAVIFLLVATSINTNVYSNHLDGWRSARKVLVSFHYLLQQPELKRILDGLPKEVKEALDKLPDLEKKYRDPSKFIGFEDVELDTEDKEKYESIRRELTGAPSKDYEEQSGIIFALNSKLDNIRKTVKGSEKEKIKPLGGSVFHVNSEQYCSTANNNQSSDNSRGIDEVDEPLEVDASKEVNGDKKIVPAGDLIKDTVTVRSQHVVICPTPFDEMENAVGRVQGAVSKISKLQKARWHGSNGELDFSDDDYIKSLKVDLLTDLDENKGVYCTAIRKCLEHYKVYDVNE